MIENNRKDCDHCFHDTGLQLTSHPSQIEKICCKCGVNQNMDLTIQEII